ncbi:MAG TPA: hypothetical protein VN577_15980 [Terriglobales bacterium]|nr:hypothetical protein [Terriglobales bacterium]
MLRALRDMLSAVALYVLVLGGGLFISLILMSTIGFLPYSDRPGPGFYGVHLPSVQEIGFYLNFIWFALVVFVLYWGVLLYILVRLLGALHMPMWFIRSVGFAVAGIASLLGVAGAGWYIALANEVVYLGGALGAAYGAILLPRFAGERPPETRRWRHWALAPAPVLVLLGILMYPLLPDRDAQSLDFQFIRLAQSADGEELANSDLPEKEVLRSLDLKGKLHYGSSGLRGTSDLPKARVLIVFTSGLENEVRLKQPKKTNVVYVQTGPRTFAMYPPNAPTLRHKIILRPHQETSSGTTYEGITEEIEPLIGEPGKMTWYPPLPVRR